MKYLGIDYGTKQIGLAVSSREGGFALPHSVIKTDQNTISSIKKICDDENITEIVIGKSLDFTNAENPVMESIKQFKEELASVVTIPIHFENEVLTTKEAERLQGRHSKIDASAAALILKSFLDKNNGGKKTV